MVNQALALELHPSESVLGRWVRAFGIYYSRRNAVEHMKSPWSKAVILAKRCHEDVINRFGKIIADQLGPTLQHGHSYIITPVPGDPEQENFLFRALERSATEILADCVQQGLKDRAMVSMKNLLVQVRPKAKRQRQCLNTAERADNVRGLYAVRDGEDIEGRRVILVDDVITSGATMMECGRVLRQAGARHVLGVALARTIRLKPPEVYSESFGEMCA